MRWYCCGFSQLLVERVLNAPYSNQLPADIRQRLELIDTYYNEAVPRAEQYAADATSIEDTVHQVGSCIRDFFGGFEMNFVVTVRTCLVRAACKQIVQLTKQGTDASYGNGRTVSFGVIWVLVLTSLLPVLYILLLKRYQDHVEQDRPRALSKCEVAAELIWWHVLMLVLIAVVWVAVCAQLGITAISADACVNPQAFAETQIQPALDTNSTEVAIIRFYFYCDAAHPNPFGRQLAAVDEQFVNARSHWIALLQWYDSREANSSHPQQFRADVSSLNSSVVAVADWLKHTKANVRCTPIHNSVVRGVTAACEGSLSSVFAVLVIEAVVCVLLLAARCLLSPPCQHCRYKQNDAASLSSVPEGGVVDDPLIAVSRPDGLHTAGELYIPRFQPDERKTPVVEREGNADIASPRRQALSLSPSNTPGVDAGWTLETGAAAVWPAAASDTSAAAGNRRQLHHTARWRSFQSGLMLDMQAAAPRDAGSDYHRLPGQPVRHADRFSRPTSRGGYSPLSHDAAAVAAHGMQLVPRTRASSTTAQLTSVHPVRVHPQGESSPGAVSSRSGSPSPPPMSAGARDRAVPLQFIAPRAHRLHSQIQMGSPVADAPPSTAAVPPKQAGNGRIFSTEH